jgi:very-short-patch-repair endonuclease
LPFFAQAAIDVAIAAVARCQHGNVTHSQLIELGLSLDAIKYRLKVGRLHRVFHRVYAVGHPPTSMVQRAAAAVLACGPEAALSHGSAATLWGIWKRYTIPFEVIAPSDHRITGIKSHRIVVDPRDLTTQLGIHVTTPARTLADIAPRLTDKQLSRAVNGLLLSPFLGPNTFTEFVQHNAGLPGIARLRPFVARAHTPSRSELEDAFHVFAARYQLPDYDINTDVVGHEADVVFRDHKLIVELDGYEFHNDRQSFEQDRERDADVLDRAGRVTLRLTWDRMHEQPGKEAARIKRIAARC